MQRGQAHIDGRQEDEHFYQVLRYVERNPLRANLVETAEAWKWSSLSVWKGDHPDEVWPTGPRRSETAVGRRRRRYAPVPFVPSFVPSGKHQGDRGLCKHVAAAPIVVRKATTMKRTRHEEIRAT